MPLKRQQGITLIGFISFAFIISVLGLLVMRVAPVYIQHYTVVQSAKSLRNLPNDQLSGSPALVRMHLKDKLINQLYINGIEQVKPKNIKVKSINNGYKISIIYDVQIKLMSNIDVLFHFNSIVKVFPRGS